MLLATAALLVGNRLLPETLPDRRFWEESCFWLAWCAAAIHAAWRAGGGQLVRAWSEQCRALAVLASIAVVANAWTTGDHLLATLARGYWPVAGVDLMLLGTALCAALVSVRLARRERASVGAPMARAWTGDA
jgi:hypothetical protein